MKKILSLLMLNQIVCFSITEGFEREIPARVIPNLPPYINQVHKDFIDIKDSETIKSILHKLKDYDNSKPLFTKPIADPDPTSYFWIGYLAPGVFLPNGTNDKCRADSITYLTGLASNATWALSMEDSTGKFTDGLVGGGVSMMGSYYTCIKSQAPQSEENPDDYDFQGKFCTMAIYLNPNLPQAQDLELSHSKDGLGNIIPSLMDQDVITALSSGIQRGICVPNSCTPNDVMVGSWIAFKMALGGYELFLPLIQNENQCSVKENRTYDSYDIMMVIIIAVILFTNILSTAYDVYLKQTNQKPDTELKELATTFSIPANTKKLFSTKIIPGSINCLHGMRFFSFTWVVIGHAYSTTFGIPSANLFNIVEMINKFAYEALANATVSVDSFFFMSGLLVAYNMLKQLDRIKGKGVFTTIKLVLVSYLNRYLRMTPVLLVVVGIATTIIMYTGDGPIFKSQVGGMVQNCRHSWWTNIIYLNNFFEMDKMCIGHVWYLANDFQMFVFSPLLIIPLHLCKNLGEKLLILVTLTFIAIPGYVIEHFNFGPGTIIVSQQDGQEKFMDEFYIKPYTRAGPYLIGIWLGYILYKTKGKKIKMSFNVAFIGWTISAATAMMIVYGLHDYNKFQYPMMKYSRSVAIIYGALHRTVWAAALGWVVFACHTGYGGVINRFLSWKAFIPLSRLSYCGYLLSIPIQVMVRGQNQVPFYQTDLKMMYFMFGDLTFTLIASVVFFVCAESPMSGISKYILGKLNNRNRTLKKET